jgi:hypothetical protein
MSLICLIVLSWCSLHGNRKTKMPFTGPMMGWPNQWWDILRPGWPMMGKQRKLFDNFCQSWVMKDSPWFMEKFRPPAEDRFEKINFIKKHLEKVISWLKDKSNDTSKLESQLKEINNIIAEFSWHKEEFVNSWQKFCDNGKKWMDLNIRLRQLMGEVSKEIEKIE